MSFVDAEGAIRDWINESSDTAPVRVYATKGAHLKRLRSPYQGAYIVLRRVGGGQTLTAEVGADRARISATIYGVSKEGASKAAVAYANAIERVRSKTAMGDATCEFVANISGPSDQTLNQDEPRYLVDADFYLR
jgi:hypothetical protein